MEKLPAPGDLYRHFTDRIYQVIAIAVHADSGEQMAVYQAMSGDYGIYTMPLVQFESEIDDEKYPGSSQQHLFERIERTGQPGWKPEAGGLSARKTEPGEFHKALPESGTQDTAVTGNRVRELPVSGTDAQRAGGRIRDAAPSRPQIHRPADSRRAFSQNGAEVPSDGASDEKRRRQIEEREQRRGLFRKPEKHETATEELRANPCLLKFLEADTYEERFHVLNQIQDEITDRLIDDMAVVLDVVIPEGPLSDRFHQLKDVILTRQKYETSRFR